MPMTFTSVEIGSAILTGIGAPLTVWLVQSTFKSLKRANAMALKFVEYKKDTEVKLSDVCRDLASLKETHSSSDVRLIKVEDAILAIRNAVQRSDEQFTAIMAELKQLPRVMTMMESFAVAIAAIVPRNEVDARLKSHEDRIRLVEVDIRKSEKL